MQNYCETYKGYTIERVAGWFTAFGYWLDTGHGEGYGTRFADTLGGMYSTIDEYGVKEPGPGAAPEDTAVESGF